MNRARQASLLLAPLLAACGPAPQRGDALGDAARGKIALTQHACPVCHVIPGVVGADSRVGPSLESWAQRAYIAGRLPNTPDNLVDWIRHPQRLAPGNAMPDLGVSEQDAWDMAAYLYRPD